MNPKRSPLAITLLCLALLPTGGSSPILMARRPLKTPPSLRQLIKCHEKSGAALTACRAGDETADSYILAPGLATSLESTYRLDLPSLIDRLFLFGQVKPRTAIDFGQALSEMEETLT